MPLVKCPECQKDVSTEALACPQCAYPFPGKNGGKKGLASTILQSCPDCERPVSKHAKSCPHCGVELLQSQKQLVAAASTVEETWLCTHCGTPYTRKVQRDKPGKSSSVSVASGEHFSEVPDELKPQLNHQGHDHSTVGGRHPSPLWQDSNFPKEPPQSRYPRKNRKSLLLGVIIVLILTISVAFGALWHWKGLNPLDLLAVIQNWT